MTHPNRAQSSSSPSRHLPSPAEMVSNDDDLTFVPKQNSKEISGLFFRLTLQGPRPSYGFINLSSSSSTAPFTSLDFVLDPFGIRILESCNGLMLCGSDRDYTAERNFYVYNPTTKQSTTLPGYSFPVISGASLAFDPSKSSHYKVICITDVGPVTYSDQYHYQMVIYSSKTGAWRPCGNPFTAPDVDFTNGVFWNGSVHWPSTAGSSSLRFDADEERLREMPMPIPVAPDEEDDVTLLRYRYFGESRDHLHFVEIHESNLLQFDIYELETDYSGWFVRYKVDLNAVAVAFPEMFVGTIAETGFPYYVFSMLGVVRGEMEEEESYLVLQLPPHQAVRYNLRDGNCIKICDLAPDEYGVRVYVRCPSNVVTYEVYQFIESLACV